LCIKLLEAIEQLKSAGGTGATLLIRHIDSASATLNALTTGYNEALSLKKGENFEDFFKVVLGPPQEFERSCKDFHENLVVARNVLERLKSVINCFSKKMCFEFDSSCRYQIRL
jgi:hypothetical protein